MISQVVRPLCRNVFRADLLRTNLPKRQAHAVAKAEKAYMDRAPIPEGSFQEADRKKNARYNLYLLGSISFFIATVAYAEATGHLFINASVPPLPNEK